MLQFSKMHGLGNDFVVINGIEQKVNPHKLPIKQLADRHIGIGFNQLLIVTPSANADFHCQIFNADGTEAEQCGNGLRCVARFIHDKDLSQKHVLSIETKAGIYEATIQETSLVKVTMGTPSHIKTNFSVTIKSQEIIPLTLVSMGNPHTIMILDSIKNFPIRRFGKLIGSHEAFPQGVNVGFMEIINNHHILLRTYERGAGHTHACGSNACAAVVAGITQGLLNHKVQVELALGSLLVEWQGDTNPVIMTGPAERVFEGNI